MSCNTVYNTIVYCIVKYCNMRCDVMWSILICDVKYFNMWCDVMWCVCGMVILHVECGVWCDICCGVWCGVECGTVVHDGVRTGRTLCSLLINMLSMDTTMPPWSSPDKVMRFPPLEDLWCLCDVYRSGAAMTPCPCRPSTTPTITTTRVLRVVRVIRVIRDYKRRRTLIGNRNNRDWLTDCLTEITRSNQQPQNAKHNKTQQHKHANSTKRWACWP
jgi:hypothetical protein